VKFFAKSIGGRSGNVTGENQDLGELHREKEKREAALSEVSGKIAAIEETARVKREAEKRRQSEQARLQKRLKACHDAISWTENRLAELKEMAHAQVSNLLDGGTEAYFGLKSTLQEEAEWRRELELFREFSDSLPQEISKLAASA
jgi:chromosome segregation ATPase